MLMSRLHETIIFLHELCECKYRFKENISNPKQQWNHVNAFVNVKNLLIGVLVNKITCRILVVVIVSLIKSVKLVSI